MNAQNEIIDPHNKHKLQDATNGAVATQTPQSNDIFSTMPSPLTMPSAIFSRTSSGACTSRSGQRQLETLLEELAVANNPFSTDLNSSSKRDSSSLEESDSNKAPRLKLQLVDFKKGNAEKSNEVNRLILRVRELERERDQEKNDRVFAAVAHQKEIAAITEANINHAVMRAELDSLRKVVNVSETSYKELVAAIDNEKEKISHAHASKVQQLENEIKQLRQNSDHTGAIESSRLLEELTDKKKEIAMLSEQCRNLSREISVLTATNLKLESEKEIAASEISVLKSKVDKLQTDLQQMSHQPSSRNHPERGKDIKKLEFELQSERNRRVILESSLQKEYDRPTQPPTCIPFGYPPMQMYAPDNSSISKLKITEIDLATERANKELLENIIQELRSANEQEASDLHFSRTEVDRINRELEKVKSAYNEVTYRFHDTSSELSHTASELSDIKNQMLQISCELSSSNEEKNEMIRKLSKAEKELLSTKQALHKINEEAETAKDALRRKETEVEFWASENARLKKEYSEAIEIFEGEIFRANEKKEEIGSSLGDEIRRLNSEVQQQNDDLGTAKLHLENMLVEMEAAHTDVKHLNIALDGARADVRLKEEQLNQAIRTKEEQLNQAIRIKEEQLNQARNETGMAKQEVNDVKDEMSNLIKKYEELTDSILRAHENICSVQRRVCRNQNDETLETLRMCETAVESINTAVGNLKADNIDITTRYSSLKELNVNMESFLSSIPRELEGMLPGFESSTTIAKEVPEDEDSNTSFEFLRNQTYHFLRMIYNHMNELKGVIHSTNNTLEKTQWNLSNTADDLEKLESKYMALKKQMKELRNLQQGYNELKEDYHQLLGQYELEVEDKEALKNHLASIHLTKELKLTEERDLLEAQLKEAVDDLEELEGERDALLSMRDVAAEESARKDSRIRALEIDNQLIEVLEKQALEYDAALFQKDMTITTLEGTLQSIQSELSLPFVHHGEASIFPNILYSSQQDTVRMKWFEDNAYTEQSRKNPFVDDSLSPDESDDNRTLNPSDDDLSGEEEEQNVTDRALKMSVGGSSNHEIESKPRLREEIASDIDIEAHREELLNLRGKLHELQHICYQSLSIIKTESGCDDALAFLQAYAHGSPQEENESHNQTFKLHDIIYLPSALTAYFAQTKHEVILLQNEIQTLKGCIEKLTSQLARSKANNSEITIAHETTMIDREKFHNDARESDLALIASLENALRQKEIQLQDKMQALRDQEELHLSDTDTLKSQIGQLEKSNEALNLKVAHLCEQQSISIADDHTECIKKLSLVQIDLEKSLIDNENNRIKHSIELASINGELHNAMVAIDDLSKDNEAHKKYIQVLSSKETEEDRNFEKELNAAHVRFESMERALQQRVSRLVKEKDKLVADFNVERANKDEDHTKTRIELCAWKLGKLTWTSFYYQ
jgi:chromosome segregation ATPase